MKTPNTLKTIALLALAALLALSLISCTPKTEKQPEPDGKSSTGTSAENSSTTANENTPTVPSDPQGSSDSGSESTVTPDTPTDKLITATIKSTANDYEITEQGENSVTVVGKKKPAAGDVVTAETKSHFLKVKATGMAKAAIVYLPEGVFTYTMPAGANIYTDGNFTAKAFNFTFSIPTEKELSEERNVALNPFDNTEAQGVFPHASSSNVYDDFKNGQFIPRNAIDGYVTNKGHGNYPYQSWGPKAVVSKRDHFTVDLGRTVRVSSITLYLRADGFGSSRSHDAYFSEIVLEFSNGTSVTINPTKTADKQTFEFDAVDTTYVKLTGFVTDKSGSDGWAAITEIVLNGCETGN